MFRLCLSKCKPFVESSFLKLNAVSTFNCSAHSQQELFGQHLQIRSYHVNDGSPLWHRRRAKEIKQRKRVINPSSPVIDHKFPLPVDDTQKFPPELFGFKDLRITAKEHQEQLDVMTEVNKQIENKSHGRLFGVINLNGKQFKVTAEDIIIIQGYWAPNVGDRLRLHKVLLVGSSDFTLAGRPILDNDLVRIEGTIIEKTLSYTKLHFKLKKRKNYRRLKFMKDSYTMVRINMIELLKPLQIPTNLEKDEDETIDVNFKVAASAST